MSRAIVRPLNPSAAVSESTPVAASVLAAIALIVLGKLIAVSGAALQLPDACWQLLGARSAAATIIIVPLVALRLDRMTLFGAVYAAGLSLSHFSGNLVGATLLAGITAHMVARMAVGRLGMTVASIGAACTFGVVMSLARLIRAISAEAPLATSAGRWAGDAGVRLGVGVIVGLIAYLVVQRLGSTGASESAARSDPGC